MTSFGWLLGINIAREYISASARQRAGSNVHPSPSCLTAVTSETFEDENCSNSAMSEEDLETQSTCSMKSGGNSPLQLQCPFSSSSSPSFTYSSSSSPSPSSRPCSLELPSTVSLSDFGLISPILGPRSECSGASSPECDMERGEMLTVKTVNLDYSTTLAVTVILLCVGSYHTTHTCHWLFSFIILSHCV